jgi:hypothetical protein
MQASISTTPVTRLFVETDGMTLTNTTDEPLTEGQNATAAAQSSQSGILSQIRGRFITASAMTINAEIPEQAEPGAHTVAVSVYPYPATLPRGVLGWLHEIHPVVAAFGSTLAPFSLGYLGYWLVLDPSTPLRDSRRRWLQRVGGR